MTSLVLLSLCSALVVQAAPPPTFTLKRGTVSYKIIHKLHEVTGTSQAARGTAKLLKNKTLEVRASVPVATFDSGNANRDAHMLEAVEAARFKTVELRARMPNFRLPPKFPAKARMKVPAQISFHGVEREETLALDITFQDAKRVVVNATFTVSLEAYKVERPSLMFIQINDPMTVVADLHFEKRP